MNGLTSVAVATFCGALVACATGDSADALVVEEPPVAFAAEPSIPTATPPPPSTRASCIDTVLDPCAAGLSTITPDELSKRRRASIGQVVRVRGTLNRIEGGCTEADCNNICRDSMAIGDGALGRQPFLLIDDGSGRFECTRSAGDPCDGHEPPELTMPCCRLSPDGGEVVATATVRDWDGRGGVALEGVTLCRP